MSSRKLTAVLTLGLALSMADTANAYIFDAVCAPETNHVVGADAPNLFFVLDASGSMNETSLDPSLTRWEAATLAIDEVVSDITNPGACTMPGDPNCDTLRFGVGYFANGAYTGVPVQEDANDAAVPTITDSLAAAGPPGGGQYTEVGAAGVLIRDEPSLQDPSRSNVAVLVSDGAPTDSSGCTSTTKPIDQTVAFVQAACTARNRASAPVQTYSVGFGTGSSADTNSLFAAAGGTGTCCLAADCTNMLVDPCTMSEADLRSHLTTVKPSFCRQAELLSTLQCTGSIEATSPADLKAALLTIAGTAACTFPLEIPTGYPFTGAQVDPDATRVLIEHTFSSAFMPPGQIGIPNVGDPAAPMSDLDQELIALWAIPPGLAAPYDNEGWYFSDTNRQFVTLTPALCGDITSGALTNVRTQVACACVKAGPCTAVDLAGFTPTELSNMRCGVGTWQCISGEDVCVAAGDPYPEICNGIDDDCDGNIDNIADSWAKPEHASYVIPPEHAGVSCQMRTTCTCPGGWQDPISGDSWDSMLDGWTGQCQCGEGLSEPGEDTFSATSESEPSADDDFADDSQACASAPATPQHSPWLMLAGAIAVGLITTRRR